MPFNAAFQVLNWYPLITVPFFVFMGYMLSESGMANNLYRMFHVWFGPVRGGLALGTIGLMVLIAALNGLSASPAWRSARRSRCRNCSGTATTSVMVTGVIQGGSSLGILIPPSVVLVLYAMIARQPVLQLWLAGIFPGLMMAAIFAALHLHPLPRQSGARAGAAGRGACGQITWREKISLLREGILPLAVFGIMMAPVPDRHRPAWSRARPSARCWRRSRRPIEGKLIGQGA